MKNNHNILLLVIALAGVVSIGVYSFFGNKKIPEIVESVPSVVSTTTEVVFATSTQIATTTEVTEPVPLVTKNSFKIGKKILLNDIFVTITKVTQDSRCPKDVQCISAGTVELNVLLENGTTSQNITLGLRKPVVFSGKNISLTEVTPAKISTVTIKDSEYEFVITVIK